MAVDSSNGHAMFDCLTDQKAIKGIIVQGWQLDQLLYTGFVNSQIVD